MLNQIIQTQKTKTKENFPVASFFLPKPYREIIIAFYNFVRFADDIADHPRLDSDQKLIYLNALEKHLLGTSTKTIHPYFEEISNQLLKHLKMHDLKATYLLDLLHIFKKECTHHHPDHILIQEWDDLIDYCKYSANPVGRFLIDLFKESKILYAQSDALCTLLQILNHIQDIKKDWKQNKHAYIPKSWWKNKKTPSNLQNYGLILQKIPHFLQKIDGFSDKIEHPKFKKEVFFVQSCAKKLAKKLCSNPTSPTNIKLNKFEYLICFLRTIIS